MNLLADVLDYLLTGSSWTGDGGLLVRLLEQLLLTGTALALAVAVALPLALWLGHLGRGGFLAINVSNVGRAVPTFALLAILVRADWPGTATFGPYGRAGLATLIALTVFALPPLITNGYTAVREVSADVRHAADGMGMSGWQKFRRVELPLSLPLVVSGVRLALVQIWATATIAALVAGPGVGRIITDGFATRQVSQGVGAALVVAAVALLLELLAATLQRAVDPTRPARSRRREPDGSALSGVTPKVEGAVDAVDR